MSHKSLVILNVAVILTLALTLLFVNSMGHTRQAEAAAGICYGAGNGDVVHRYSIGFTTCGQAYGVSATMTPLSSIPFVTIGAQSSHVNGTVWVDTGLNGSHSYPEMGYWRGNMVWCDCAQTANYGGITYNGVYNDMMFYDYGYSSPTVNFGKSFLLKTHTGRRDCYDYYLQYEFQITICGFPSSAASRVSAGLEEQDEPGYYNRLPGPHTRQQAPLTKFSNLRYLAASNNRWYSWGNYSHCFTNYANGEAFDVNGVQFPTSFKASIDDGGAYKACNGARPNVPRSTW